MKIIRSELDDAVRYLSIINDEISNTESVIEKVKAFQDNSSGKLEGDSWKAILSEFTSRYTNILGSKNNMLNQFVSGVQNANKIMIDYFNNFPDGSKEVLDNDGEVYNYYKNERDTNLKKWEDSLVDRVVGKDANGHDIKSHTENIEARERYYFCKKCLEYLDELPSRDASANALLNDSRDSITDIIKSPYNSSIFVDGFSAASLSNNSL